MGDLVSRLMLHDVEPTHTGAVDRLRQLAEERGAETVSPLERGEREEALGAWLEARQTPNAWAVAGAFTDAGLVVADLDRFEASVPPTMRDDALGWVACGLGSSDSSARSARRPRTSRTWCPR